MKTFIGFRNALDLTLSNVSVGKTEFLPLDRATGKIIAEDVAARVDSPSVSSSRKDGYAVVSLDITEASDRDPVRLKVVGNLMAGTSRELKIRRGQAVRITTGAPLPDGADAVISEEFCRREENTIIAYNTAEAGRNIHACGKDIRQAEIVAKKNSKLTPALVGLLAAAGLDGTLVYKSPKVAVIATGDEVVLPGQPLTKGKLYASNLVEICAWLSQLGLIYKMELVPDSRKAIENAVTKHMPEVDVFLTSGGAWGSERDLILEVVEGLKWQGVFHRIRMGPGKPAAFGLLDKKPFFCLPGGPPSNEMAFLQLALPALLKMKGDYPFPFPLSSAWLGSTVHGRKEWTDFIHARLENRQNQLIVHPLRLNSALQSMAQKEALIIIPENRKDIAAGEVVNIQLLGSSAFPISVPYQAPKYGFTAPDDFQDSTDGVMKDIK